MTGTGTQTQTQTWTTGVTTIALLVLRTGELKTNHYFSPTTTHQSIIYIYKIIKAFYIWREQDFVDGTHCLLTLSGARKCRALHMPKKNVSVWFSRGTHQVWSFLVAEWLVLWIKSNSGPRFESIWRCWKRYKTANNHHYTKAVQPSDQSLDLIWAFNKASKYNTCSRLILILWHNLIVKLAMFKSFRGTMAGWNMSQYHELSQYLELRNKPLSCLAWIYPAFANSVDPDQLASKKPTDLDLHCHSVCKFISEISIK